MDKLTKQAHLLHSFVAHSIREKTRRMAEAISEEFAVPIDEAMDKCSVLTTGLLLHIIHLLITEKMESGTIVAKKFLHTVGKSEDDIKYIHKTFGDLKTTTERKFKKQLEDYLSIPTNDLLAHWCFERIRISCESIVETVSKKADKVEVKDGVFDYTDSALDYDDLESKTLEDSTSFGMKIQNGHVVIDLDCACGYKGTVTFGKTDFKLLGKDRKGFIYFECPKCKQHLQYDPVTGKVKTRKGILGFLFGSFS